MVSRISHTTFDALDAQAQSVFWSAVLGYSEDPSDPNEPGDDECMIFPPQGGGQRLLFVTVPDAKGANNRVHLDLRPVQASREDEVARAMALGASWLGDHRRADGTGWIVLADPEGNEFCILSPADPQ